ncbi:MAG: hypothetical protein WCS03_01335 [Bacteroidota bacterium]
MSSIIAGYEYDIFISYRQKDNKGERWVSKFVEALKIELESTFKEEVSVYFDINPHDGLLETHDVDASLREKLKCLIFIPIISQTYCDSKCFAWQYEFVAFNKMAKEDRFGREIKLLSGNVASRILPIKIHVLDPDDNILLEKELGGVLRGVEFIYKSAGVNRPLRANEDHPQDNLNKTYYRDQINKTANAVKEIITALKKHDSRDSEIPKFSFIHKHEKSISFKTKIFLISVIMLIMIILSYLLIPKLSGSTEPATIRIAVLPFDNFFSDKDKSYEYLSESIPNRINDQLRSVKEFTVIPYYLTRKYYGKDIPSRKQICKECNADVLVYGRIELLNNNTDAAISIQLANRRNNYPTYLNKFVNKFDSLQSNGSKISIEIAQKLQVSLLPEEVKNIKTGITKSSEAYMNYLLANYQDETLMGKRYNDTSTFEMAIKMYDKAIRSDSTFALAYARRSISRSWAYRTGSMTQPANIEKCREDAERALNLDPKLAEAQNAFGFYYYSCNVDYQKALESFKKASELDSRDWQSIFYQAMVYRRIGQWIRSQALLTKVLKYNPQDPSILTNIGLSYYYLRNYDSALIYHNLAIKIAPNWSAPYVNKILALILKNGSTREARITIDSALKKTIYKFKKWEILLDIYDSRYDDALLKTELSDQSDFNDQGDKLLTYGMIHKYLEHIDMARKLYDSARVFYTKKLKEDPDNASNNIKIGLAYAGLKNRSNAVEAGMKALKLCTDALTRNDILMDLTQIYLAVGDYENCFRQINDLLKNPSDLSIKLLQLDPVWKPIREKPEFKKILTEFSEN